MWTQAYIGAVGGRARACYRLCTRAPRLPVGVCIDRRSGTGTGPALKDTVESLVKLRSDSLIDTPLECADIENKRMNVTCKQAPLPLDAAASPATEPCSV